MAINYRVFARMMHRANEVANQAGIPSIIVRVYKERLEGAAQAYLTVRSQGTLPPLSQGSFPVSELGWRSR